MARPGKTVVRVLRCYEHGHEFPASEDNWYALDSCYRCPQCGSPSMDPDTRTLLYGIRETLKQM